MCSAVRWEADTSSRDCFHWNYLCLRHLKHVSHARLQMLAHSCYHSKWHAAFFLQEAFYSEPLLADSSCWIEMTVSSVRSHFDLFQKRKPKTNIDANFGIMFNFHFISNQLYIISEKKMAMISTTALLPSPSLLHAYNVLRLRPTNIG